MNTNRRIEKITGTRNFAERTVLNERQAAESFYLYAMERAQLTRTEAEAALDVMVKAKVLKLDAMDGTFKVKHGAFLDAPVLRRAAGKDE